MQIWRIDRRTFAVSFLLGAVPCFGQNTPYGGRTSCVAYGVSAGNGGATLITGFSVPSFCIETTARATATQATAISTCSGLGSGWGLCTQIEITAACYARYDVSSSDSIAQSIAQNYHWTVDVQTTATNGLVVGGAGCINSNLAAMSNSYVYRCCLR